MSYESRQNDALAKVIVIGACVAISGLYHLFATTNKDITDATVTGTKVDWHMESYYSNKRWHTRKEWDYYIYTDKGTLRDESCAWSGKLGDNHFMNKMEVGSHCNFKVNHDNLTGMDNVLEFKKIAAAPDY